MERMGDRVFPFTREDFLLRERIRTVISGHWSHTNKLPSESYDVHYGHTTNGIQRFVADYKEHAAASSVKIEGL